MKLNRSIIYNTSTFLITLSGMILVISFPQISSNCAWKSLELCFKTVIPSLFPFFVFSSVFVEMGYADYISEKISKYTDYVFKIRGSCVCSVILGLVSGFPVGARTSVLLYKEGRCTKTEAERTLSFCNNAGPSFIVGVVGAGIWKNAKTGIMLLFSQILSALITGVIMGRLWKGEGNKYVIEKKVKNQNKSFLSAFVSAVKTSGVGMIHICSFIVFFSVIIGLLIEVGFIHHIARFLNLIIPCCSVSDFENILAGIVEMTTGINMIGSVSPVLKNLVITGALIGWAGLSVHFQVLSYVCDSGLSVRPYLIGKIFQTVFSALFTFVFSFLFKLNCVGKTKFDIGKIISFLHSPIMLILAFIALIFIVFFNVFKRKRGKLN